VLPALMEIRVAYIHCAARHVLRTEMAPMVPPSRPCTPAVPSSYRQCPAVSTVAGPISVPVQL